MCKDAMEANSLDDFHLSPPGWSDSSQPESNDCDANTLWGRSYVMLAQTHPQYNQPHLAASFSLSQTKM